MNYPYRIEPVECGVTLGDRGQLGLYFDRDNFAWTPQRRDHHRNHPASGAQIEYPIARTYSRKASEQNRVDRKTVTIAWLDERQGAA